MCEASGAGDPTGAEALRSVWSRLARCALIGLAVTVGCEPRQTSLSMWRPPAEAGSAEPCGATAARGHSSDTAVVVLEVQEPLCDLVAEPVVTLDPMTDGSRPDPGRKVVATSDDRYFTTSRAGPQILEWGSDGTYVRSVGRAGEGPGELSPRGAPKLFLDDQDSLFVLDGSTRWSVFDPGLTYVRSFLGSRTTGQTSAIHFVPGRGILSTACLPAGGEPAGRPFHWTDRDGRLEYSFGEYRVPPPPRPVQASAMTEDGFWVTPPSAGRLGLVLEHWTYEGEKTRTLERRVSWLPPDGYEARPGEPPLPEFERIHIDPDGLLWVTLAVRDPRWRETTPSERSKLASQLYDGRLEVIDPRAGVVVASYRYDGPDEEPSPIRFLRGRRAYRLVSDSLGLTSVEVVNVSLASR